MRFLWILLAPSLAYAEPDTRESAIVDEIVPLRRDQVGWRATADAVGVVIADSDSKTAGAVTASGEVALTATPDCDLVKAGAQVGSRSDERVVSAQQWASFCPLGGDGNLTIDHRLEWNVSPRLTAAPRMRPGVQNRETVGISFAGSHVATNDPTFELTQAGTARLELQVDWNGETTEIHPSFNAELRSFRHTYDDGTPLELTIFGAGLDVNVVNRDPSAPFVGSLSVNLARVEGLRLGAVRLGARLGGRVVPETSGRRMMSYAIGEGGISLEHDLARDVTLRAVGERLGWPTWDGRFVVDDRATLSLIAGRGRLTGRIDASAAATHLLAIDAQHGIATGGISAQTEYRISNPFGLALHSEFARSAYAPGASLDDPRWASETLLLLHYRNSTKPRTSNAHS